MPSRDHDKVPGAPKPDPIDNNYIPRNGNPYANPFTVTRRTPVTGTRWDGVTKP